MNKFVSCPSCCSYHLVAGSFEQAAPVHKRGWSGAGWAPRARYCNAALNQSSPGQQPSLSTRRREDKLTWAWELLFIFYFFVIWDGDLPWQVWSCKAELLVLCSGKPWPRSLLCAEKWAAAHVTLTCSLPEAMGSAALSQVPRWISGSPGLSSMQRRSGDCRAPKTAS